MRSFPRSFPPISHDDGTASLALALEVAEYFELPSKEAWKIAGEIAAATATWRAEAAALGLTKAAIDQMASAFEHEDLQAALSGKR